jgi:hypothetical protein
MSAQGQQYALEDARRDGSSAGRQRGNHLLTNWRPSRGIVFSSKQPIPRTFDHVDDDAALGVEVEEDPHPICCGF